MVEAVGGSSEAARKRTGLKPMLQEGHRAQLVIAGGFDPVDTWQGQGPPRSSW